MTELGPEDLPGVLADMAEIAGVDKTLEYAARFGGPTVYMPREWDAMHPECMALAAVFGEAAGREILARIGPGQVELPTAKRQRIAFAVAQGGSVKDLCRTLGVCARTIRRERARRVASAIQIGLFDGTRVRLDGRENG